MTIRDVFILALRLLGSWAFVDAASGLGYALASTYEVAQLIPRGAQLPPGVDLWHVAVIAWAQPVTQCVIAIILWLFSPGIARLFYRGAEEWKFACGMTPEAIYRGAAQILGLYAIIRAIPPAARSIAWLNWHWSGEMSPYDAAAFVETAIYLIVGAMLIMGATPIARWLDRLRPGYQTTNASQPQTPPSSDPPTAGG
jgi:hypothetical protein